MLVSLLTFLLATPSPAPATTSGLVRAVLIHVRDANASFDSETDPPTKWFDSKYDTVFVSCGLPPGVTMTPPEPSPCTIPSDLLQSHAGKRTLEAGPVPPRRSRNKHAFDFYITYIDLQGSTADVGVQFDYYSYFCTGTYHMRFIKGAWQVEKAELGAIS